jgi:hypothetical protein
LPIEVDKVFPLSTPEDFLDSRAGPLPAKTISYNRMAAGQKNPMISTRAGAYGKRPSRVSPCAKQGYKVTATIVDYDGVDQAMLRGDGASMTTLDASRDKAYTRCGSQ